ncbi:GNAT family N-acetyltransferase [Bacillus cereus group sp. Bce005]|uniref:GNAT family N-acetyltransferase n=1 Tax=Bacillus cereus group TaxID=86661 RepID=UPI00234AC88A|nr:GNAT family protein [Bacillus albus]MDC6159347.1 GNAT family protein [Bacillus albus]MDD8008824.1 GNAT family protein [Bacillus albus]
MIKELNTQRLHLRRMAVSDSHSLFKIWSDPDVTRFMNISNFTHEAQAKEMIELLEELAQASKAIRFSMIELKSNEIIGTCGFNSIDFENAKAEIGYDIAKAYWGKGYAPEGISALLNYGFETLKLNRIEAKVEPANVNSIKVIEKLHFTFEGTLRQYEKSKGNFIDIKMYSLLKTD